MFVTKTKARSMVDVAISSAQRQITEQNEIIENLKKNFNEMKGLLRQTQDLFEGHLNSVSGEIETIHQAIGEIKNQFLLVSRNHGDLAKTHESLDLKVKKLDKEIGAAVDVLKTIARQNEEESNGAKKVKSKKVSKRRSVRKKKSASTK